MSPPTSSTPAGSSPSTLNPRPSTSPPPPSKAPPEWPVERLVKSIGRAPKAAGKALDRLAKAPVIGPVVRQFSSIWFGIILLVLIATYVAIGSGFPDLRAHFEITDLQFFDAWPMRILLACLALDLSIVTLRRIPLTLLKLGSWTVHIGILTLIGGCVWYFSHKQEGSVRIYLDKSVNYCYDVTERALYAYPVNPDGTFDTDHPTITPLPTLPIYAEHLAEDGNPVDITLGSGVLPDKSATVHITGYYPAAMLHMSDVRAAGSGETGQGPAIDIAVKTDRDNMGEDWLIAGTPANRGIEGNLPFSIDYLNNPSPERIRGLQAPFQGSMGITVRIPSLNIERTYSAVPGTPIPIQGSDYTLTPMDSGAMPMASKGYEDSESSYLRVGVSRKAGAAGKAMDYVRMCLSRFPERSPDFITEDGKQVRKQDGVDPNIEITFQDAQHTHAWIIQAADGSLSLITRTPDGKSTTLPIADQPVPLPVPEQPGLQLSITQRIKNAVPVMTPVIIPPEQRPRGQTVMEILQLSMIDVDITTAAGTQSHVYVPFSPYAEIGRPPVGEQPAVISTPTGKVGLLLATSRRALPSTLTLTHFQPVKYAGAMHTYENYISTLVAKDPGEVGTHTLVTQLNNPATDHGLYYFQAAWDGDDNAPASRRFSVIGVGNHPGVIVMVIGAILIVLGIGYAFYIKPLLLKAKKESLAAWNARRNE